MTNLRDKMLFINPNVNNVEGMDGVYALC